MWFLSLELSSHFSEFIGTSNKFICLLFTNTTGRINLILKKAVKMGSINRRNRQRNEFGRDFESTAIHEEASSVTFRPYSGSEIKQLSACHVFNTTSFNQLGHPVANGLYDLKMGPFTDRNNVKCATCLLTSDLCPGHIGHIELPLPVCNPLFYSTILRLLKMSCMTCHQFRVPQHVRKLFLVQQILLDSGNIIAAQKVSFYT